MLWRKLSMYYYRYIATIGTGNLGFLVGGYICWFLGAWFLGIELGGFIILASGL